MSAGAIERTLRFSSRLGARLYTLLLASQFKAIGPGTRICPPFRFSNLHKISLGRNVVIARDCWIHAVNAGEETDAVTLTIESHAGIGMGATISAARQVVIGEYVLTARNVYISDHAHAFEDIKTPIIHQGISKITPVTIGRHSWLGQNVCVVAGAKIGEHCVIGANSVVNSAIPDYSVAVGSPARVVKRYDHASQKWVKV